MNSQPSSPLSPTTSNSNPASGLSQNELEGATPQPVFDSPCGKRARGKTWELEWMLIKLAEVVSYDPNTGDFTYVWVHHRNRTGARIGDVLRKPAAKPYLCISVNGKQYYAHRLAWLWMTGDWPKKQIDHINGNSNDNSWRNLRDVSPAENQRNKKMQVTNTSGITGVSYCKRDDYWEAKTMVNNKPIHIGSFPTKEAAVAARQLFIDTHPELGYTDRHGK